MLDVLGARIGTLLAQPVVVFFLAGLLALLLWCFYIRRVRMKLHVLITASLMLALTLLLSEIQLYHFPQGGGVTLGSMVPLILLTRCFGAEVGVLAGFLYGLIHILQDPFLLHPVQVLFDYPLPYMTVGLAALLPKHLLLSVILFFTGKFLCHFISGAAFFASYAPEGTSPILYSLTVNLSLQVPECIICCILLKLLPTERLLSAMGERSLR